MKLAVYSAQSEPLLIGSLDAEHVLIGCFETGSYLIRVPAENAKLFADDAPLEMDSLREHWLWKPGFFAGEVGFELELPGKASSIRYIVDVGPAEHKTGRAQYAEYLSQIVDYAPALISGTEPAKHGLGGRSSSAMSLWLRYARLRQFIDRYLSGLLAICERPIIRLSSRREQVPLPTAKRVDTTTLRRLASNPKLLMALTGENVTGRSTDAWKERLDVPFHEPTMDNPANRLMARQLGEVSRLTRHLLKDLGDFRQRVSETETDLMSRLPRRIRFLQSAEKRLVRLSRSEPFASADVHKYGAAEFNAVSGNALYNMTHQLGVRVLRNGLSDLADDEQHYLNPTWEIYEAWCFVTVARALENRFPEFVWKLHASPISADLILQGKFGEKAITLYYQMACSSLESDNRYGYCSVSRERRPDLVLELADSGEKQFICLDSKYSASRGRILDSMASAHIYRDSLRSEAAPPILSLILVPANPELYVLSTPDYWTRHNVGCFVLSRESDASAILDRLLPFAAKHTRASSTR